ncbi:MAG: GH116 family glycosyl-hydrolase [Candidatus Omnitrophota bacterium]
MNKKTISGWPVLRRYDAAHLHRMALPLGGIGTGTVSLGGRGDLRDWEIVNRPAKGFSPKNAFFALYARSSRGNAVARALEGPIESFLYEGHSGCPVPNHGLPKFRHCTFAAAYPLGQVMLSDPDVPLDVRLEAFNPLIPPDVSRSGMPVAVLRFVLINKTNKNVEASVCGSLQNFIGDDGSPAERRVNGTLFPAGPGANRNEFRKGEKVQGLLMRAGEINRLDERWGTVALTTTAGAGVSWRTAWTKTKMNWVDSLLDFWDDFSTDGIVEERAVDGADAPTGSLAVKMRVPPRGSRTVTFLLTWHFPNRYTWTPRPELDSGCTGRCAGHYPENERVGNEYTTRFRDAWEAAQQVAAKLPALEFDTVRFVRTFCDSSLPDAVKEAALFNLSTLRSQTCFRTADGRFFGWEGCRDNAGCCMGSATHVWNYEQATAFLFGTLSRSMRETELLHATDKNGLMSFRVSLPLDRGKEYGKAAADGQMGCIMKLYRDWQLSGDDGMLKALWPRARKALEFCWVPGGWDADRDGVMEGCQHNTMDVEYYGPNPLMGGWYLGALRAAEEMARHLGETDFAATCRDLFGRGSRWTDTHLFNGEYYEQEIRPPDDASAVAPGLHLTDDPIKATEPDYQLGAGCLVDQLAGQFMAHVCGLGYILNQNHVRTALASIMKYNFKRDFNNHFNNGRSFVLGDESALLMATYPRNKRPKRPFPYYNEVMTGFEYTAAAGMLYEHLTRDGLRCIRAIRARYDGLKRNPFDEAECGHHYARAMASWAAVPALTGFQYSGVTKTITFAAQPGSFFWSNGCAWGRCQLTKTRSGLTVRLTVIGGALALQRITLTGAGSVTLRHPGTISGGRFILLRLPSRVSLRTGPKRQRKIPA